MLAGQGEALLEVTRDGFANRFIFPIGALVVARDPVPGFLAHPARNAAGQFQFILKGDAAARYTIEASSNLLDWSFVTNILNDTGDIQFLDLESHDIPQRFYRVRPEGN